LVAWKTKYNHASHGHLGIDQSTNQPQNNIIGAPGACGLEDEVMEQADEEERPRWLCHGRRRFERGGGGAEREEVDEG
jgi:hypothetical protein